MSGISVSKTLFGPKQTPCLGGAEYRGPCVRARVDLHIGVHWTSYDSDVPSHLNLKGPA